MGAVKGEQHGFSTGANSINSRRVSVGIEEIVLPLAVLADLRAGVLIIRRPSESSVVTAFSMFTTPIER